MSFTPSLIYCGSIRIVVGARQTDAHAGETLFAEPTIPHSRIEPQYIKDGVNDIRLTGNRAAAPLYFSTSAAIFQFRRTYHGRWNELFVRLGLFQAGAQTDASQRADLRTPAVERWRNRQQRRPSRSSCNSGSEEQVTNICCLKT